MNITRCISGILLATLLAVGCVAPKPTPDPLAGWKSVGKVGYKPGKMSAEISPLPGFKEISDDAQNFVNNLPVDKDYPARRWCYWIQDLGFYEDGTGQHAVGFRIPHDGTWWRYALIYDQNNKRVKAVRYVEGRYRC